MNKRKDFSVEWHSLHASWKQITLTPDAAAASIIFVIFPMIASRWTLIFSLVGFTIAFCTAPIYTQIYLSKIQWKNSEFILSKFDFKRKKNPLPARYVAFVVLLVLHRMNIHTLGNCSVQRCSAFSDLIWFHGWSIVLFFMIRANGPRNVKSMIILSWLLLFIRLDESS